MKRGQWVIYKGQNYTVVDIDTVVKIRRTGNPKLIRRVNAKFIQEVKSDDDCKLKKSIQELQVGERKKILMYISDGITREFTGAITKLTDKAIIIKLDDISINRMIYHEDIVGVFDE